MKKYGTDFSDEQLGGIFDEYSGKAEDYMNDSGRMDTLLSRIRELLLTLSGLPVIGPYAGDIADLIDMVSDYRSGAYSALPKNTILAIVGVLIYLASPVDLIPDFIPVLGWIDDAAVFSFAYKKGLKTDLDKYREWRELNMFTEGEVIDCRKPE